MRIQNKHSPKIDNKVNDDSSLSLKYFLVDFNECIPLRCIYGKQKYYKLNSIFCSIWFYLVLFCSILFYFVLFCSILFYFALFYSVLFYFVLFCLSNTRLRSIQCTHNRLIICGIYTQFNF